MPTNCGVYVHQCLDPHCYQCEIKRLKDKIIEQEQIINFLKKDDTRSDLTKIDPELFTKSKHRRHVTPNEKVINIANMWFITITFDPSRFHNLSIDNAQEEIYILYYLALAYNQLLFNWAYGCFELQSNGTTHAHLMAHSYNPYELTAFLKQQFTYNMKNNKCIVTLPADANCQTYINKVQADKGCERKSWFSLAPHHFIYVKDAKLLDYKEKEEYKQVVKEIKDSKHQCFQFPLCKKCMLKSLKQKRTYITIYNCPNK